MSRAQDDLTVALERFELLFAHAWRVTLRAEAAARGTGSRRAPQLSAVLQALARAREDVLRGDVGPGAPGGPLGLTAMVGRGMDLELDLPDVDEAARQLERVVDEGLGLPWDWRQGPPPGWTDAVQRLPPTPRPPPPKPAIVPGVARGGCGEIGDGRHRAPSQNRDRPDELEPGHGRVPRC